MTSTTEAFAPTVSHQYFRFALSLPLTLGYPELASNSNSLNSSEHKKLNSLPSTSVSVSCFRAVLAPLAFFTASEACVAWSNCVGCMCGMITLVVTLSEVGSWSLSRLLRCISVLVMVDPKPITWRLGRRAWKSRSYWFLVFFLPQCSVFCLSNFLIVVGITCDWVRFIFIYNIPSCWWFVSHFN